MLVTFGTPGRWCQHWYNGEPLLGKGAPIIFSASRSKAASRTQSTIVVAISAWLAHQSVISYADVWAPRTVIFNVAGSWATWLCNQYRFRIRADNVRTKHTFLSK